MRLWVRIKNRATVCMLAIIINEGLWQNTPKKP
jgi:hypothetical protein